MIVKYRYAQTRWPVSHVREDGENNVALGVVCEGKASLRLYLQVGVPEITVRQARISSRTRIPHPSQDDKMIKLAVRKIGSFQVCSPSVLGKASMSYFVQMRDEDADGHPAVIRSHRKTKPRRRLKAGLKSVGLRQRDRGNACRRGAIHSAQEPKKGGECRWARVYIGWIIDEPGARYRVTHLVRIIQRKQVKKAQTELSEPSTALFFVPDSPIFDGAGFAGTTYAAVPSHLSREHRITSNH